MSVRFRPHPAPVALFFGLLLAIELLTGFVLEDQALLVQALARWTLLLFVLAGAGLLISWRVSRQTQQFADNRDQTRVRGMIAALAAEPEPGRVPRLIVEQLRELSSARLAFLARPEKGLFRVDIVAGDDARRLLGQQLQITPESAGIAGEALRTGTPAVLPDTWCDAGLASRRELALSDRIRSAGVVPLVLRGEIVGLVGLHAETPGALRPESVAVLAEYASSAAGPLENALLTASIRQRDTANQIEQEKSEFLTALVHEVRAPLAPLLGWTELLLTREYSPEQARPILLDLRESVQHLSVLVGDLVDLSRGEAGRLELQLEDLDLGQLLDTAIARWREQAPEHHFVLAVQGPLLLRGDRHRLRQVVDNLLSNAVKYSPPGSRVYITGRGEGVRKLVVRVSDQGLGLAPEEREQVFNKFFRAEAARNHAGGAGLGLALCQMIVRAHGGDIRAESDGPGRGSAFTFALPGTGPASFTPRRPVGAAGATH